MKNKITVLDIFSGCGGMSWGLHKAGFEVIAGLDTSLIALKTFSRNHKKAKVFCENIQTFSAQKMSAALQLEKGELDCLVGGPPCQGFSKNVPSSYRFLEDPRNQLFNDFLDYVAYLNPKVAIMENVAEIYNAFNGEIRRQIMDRFEELGYQVEVKILLATNYGVPQKRRRCIFFASRTNISPSFPAIIYDKNSESNLFNIKKKIISAWEAISDLPSLKHGEGGFEMEYEKEAQNEYQFFMREESERLHNHESKKLQEKQLERIKSIKAGEGYKELPKHLQPKSGYSGAYGRLDFENPSPTITRWMFHSGSGRYGHPKDERLITIREAARLQSFTDDFIFEGTYTEKSYQIGNAVPPLLTYHLASKIKDCLINDYTEAQLHHQEVV